MTRGAVTALGGLAVLAGLLVAGSRPAAPPGGLVDVAARTGIVHTIQAGSREKVHIRESMGQGACWIDHDRDGDPDLFVPNGAVRVESDYAGREDLLRAWRFYVNRGGGRLEEAAGRVGLDAAAWGIGCATGDVDADGFDDLFVTTAAGPNRLFVNTGDGRFVERTVRSNLGSLDLSASAAFGDLDGDGDLDLFVTTYLDESRPPGSEPCHWKGAQVMCGPRGYPMLPDLVYLNDGTGVFEEAGLRLGIGELVGFGLGTVVVDADDDGDLDVFVANDSSPNHLFLNRGDGSFSEEGFAAGVALSDRGATQAGMGVDAADLDGDGRTDLVVTNFSDDSHNFYRNHGGWFSDRAARSGLAAASFPSLGWAVLAEDFDLDADLDLFLVNGHVFPQVDGADPNTAYLQPLQLLRNAGGGLFTDDREAFPGGAPILARGGAVADFDGDLDPDVLVVRDGAPPLLLDNRLPPAQARRLRVRLRGLPGNPSGLGARLTLETGRLRPARQVRQVLANRGYLSASEPVPTFGLGEALRAGLAVRWTSGAERLYRDLPGDREVVLFE